MLVSVPNIIPIASLSDPRLDIFTRLTDAQLRARVDEERGLFIAEGVLVSLNALEAGCAPIAMLCETKHVSGKANALIERMGDAPIFTAEADALSALTGYPLTRGVLCAFRRPAPGDADAILASSRRVAVLEGLNDSANVGALFRSAAALGMDALLLLPDCADPMTRRTLRVSMGTVLKLPWARIDDLTPLKAHGFTTAALALREDSVSIDASPLKAAKRLALVLGAEGSGLKQETIDQCDMTAMIPMYRGIDSLNVAAAGAVAFWETAKGAHK